MTLKVGILHPGEMGSYVARTVRASLGSAWFCPAERSEATRERARDAGLTACTSLQTLIDSCEILLSVCPPHAAMELARCVAELGFRGTLVDANALSPGLMREMQDMLAPAGITLVDGGIIGLPTPAGKATLYLSGPDAKALLPLFSAGPLQVQVLGTEVGQASALKQCYAAWNKGRTALLAAVLAAAEQLQVREALEQRWEVEEAGSVDTIHARLQFVARKAWRFGGEMDEIAATFQASGLPPGFFEAAAALYRRESAFKDVARAPEVEAILAALLRAERESGQA